jgi:hypothetical protein
MPARFARTPKLLIPAALAILLAPSSSSSSSSSPSAPLGVSYGGWKGDYTYASRQLARFKEIGFPIVSFVPTYGYVGLDKIDLAAGPTPAELTKAVELALRDGFSVVIKPHLDPPIYGRGFDRYHTENHSWRVHCPWRGFFDVDPMSDAYREGIVFGSLRMLKQVFTNLGPAAAGVSVRLEVGAELMNSVVYGPERWVQLLAAAKQERQRLGLEKSVGLSHNFTHHFEIADDFVGRMSPPRRQSLRDYIRGLDALSLSQYMDLTAAVPAAERGRRLPTADEVAQALRQHEKAFREQILIGALGLAPGEIPPLHIGEFGVGRGGLQHPNVWDGAASPAEEQQLAREIARGHEGLLRYLAVAEGRTARSAILWVTGQHYDVFGWERVAYANRDAGAAIKAALHAKVAGPP